MSRHFILIIHDDQEESERFVRKLMRTEREVQAVFSTEEALETLESGIIPSLVIVDLGLNSGTATEVLNFLTHDERFDQTKVMVTSDHDTATQNRISRFRTDYVLLKPINPRQLSVMVGHLLDSVPFFNH